MNTQVWVHRHEPDPDAVEPVRRTKKSPRKKPCGGMWTSPLIEKDGRLSSGWIEWMRGEHYSPHANVQKWLLEPEDDVEVYVIDDVWDAKEIMVPKDDGLGISTEYQIDYDAVFEEYDAIYMTREGQIDTRFPNHTYVNGRRERRSENLDGYNLYGWDCACVLWDGWHFTDVGHAGEVTIPELEY